MSFDLSPELNAKVARFANETGLAPAEALETLVETGLRQIFLARKKAAAKPGDPERSIGAFADMPNLTEVVEEVIAGREARYTNSR